jgi:hypothetical protein
MSSAHVYLRLPEGAGIDDIPADTLEDCAQLVKQNSIQGEHSSSSSSGGGSFGYLEQAVAAAAAAAGTMDCAQLVKQNSLQGEHGSSSF